MGLLKGSNIRFTEASAIVGADIIEVKEADPDEVVQVVPRAAPQPVQDYADPIDDLGGDGGWELDNLDDLFDGGTSTDYDPSEEAQAWAEPLQEFEEARDRVIYSANEASDLDANEIGEQIMGAGGAQMGVALEAAQNTLFEADPEADFSRVAPYVQRRVAVEFDLELVGSVSEIRWTHLKHAEEQIRENVDAVAADIEGRHPPETFAELLAHREEILSEARLEAERLVMEAMTRSAETMAQAEQAQEQTMMELESERKRILDELREQAYRDGFHEGKSAGEQQAAGYVAEALQKLNEIAIAFPSAVKQNEEKLVTLALEIASKVIQAEIALQPEIVQRTVEMSLKRVSDLEQVTVKVNPLDLDLILPKQDTFKQLMPDVQNFSIEGSHTIMRGGCLIETNSGSINATINAQLGIIEEIFRSVRAEYEDDGMGEAG